MRMILFMICLGFGSLLKAQDVQLINSWDKSSRFLFAGLGNQLLVMDEAHKVLDVQVSGAGKLQRWTGDSLVVEVSNRGEVRIDLILADTVLAYRYDVASLSHPEFHMAATAEARLTVYDSVLQVSQQVLKVSSSSHDMARLYEKYAIRSFDLVVLGKNYRIEGNSVPEDLSRVILNQSVDKEVRVEKVTLCNEETGKYLHLVTHRTVRMN